jgi:hypothetical protein
MINMVLFAHIQIKKGAQLIRVEETLPETTRHFENTVKGSVYELEHADQDKN